MKDSFSQLDVLVIEDDAYIRKTYEYIFSNIGIIHVLMASDGRTGRTHLDAKAKDLDLIICDWELPHCTGLDLLKHLRAKDPVLPFLMVTGHADKDAVLAAREHGVSAYIIKPFSLKSLKEKIQKLALNPSSPHQTMDYFEIAERHFYGKEIQQDYAEAARWYKRAASAGNAHAYMVLGNMFSQDKYAMRNDPEAFTCYTKAAQMGVPLAYFKIGTLYNPGSGSPINDTNAFNAFLRAAEAGVPEAQQALASLYCIGCGTHENKHEALFWLNIAAKSGHNVPAQMIEAISAQLSEEDLVSLRKRIENWKPT